MKILDYVYHAPPGSVAWKQARTAKVLINVVAGIIGIIWPFLFLFLDATDEVVFYLEMGVVAYTVVFAVGLQMFTNIDAFMLKLNSAVVLFDALSLLVVIVLLALYGEGFVIYGATYFVIMYVAAYTFEATELDSRLNVRTAARLHFWTRQILYCALLLLIIVFRVNVFLKQVTVSDGIVLSELGAQAGVFTLRDLWEFFVDIVVLRVFFLGVTRLIQPVDAIDVGRSYATIMP